MTELTFSCARFIKEIGRAPTARGRSRATTRRTSMPRCSTGASATSNSARYCSPTGSRARRRRNCPACWPPPMRRSTRCRPRTAPFARVDSELQRCAQAGQPHAAARAAARARRRARARARRDGRPEPRDQRGHLRAARRGRRRASRRYRPRAHRDTRRVRPDRGALAAARAAAVPAPRTRRAQFDAYPRQTAPAVP